MIGNLNHVAIAVPNLEAAMSQYQNIFGAFVTTPLDLPLHGVRVSLVNLPNTKIELITPLGDNSPLQNFLEKHPEGGLHHLCYEVPDLEAARNQLVTSGIHVIGDGTPLPGFHGNPVLFFTPKDCFGTLIELEQIQPRKIQGRVEIERIGPIHTINPSLATSLDGFQGVGIGVEVDFKTSTPEDNNEEN